MFRDEISLLSGNKLIETLSNENDMFGTIEKAENLISIFRDMHNDIDDIKMIGIYGEWGSGKTTYMKHICSRLKELNIDGKKIYKTVFFEAWKYEMDNKLHLSLLECILESLPKNKIDECKEVLIECYSFLKNITLNSKVSLPGIEIDIGKAGADIIRESIDRKKPISFYGEVNKFIESYKKVLDKILKKEENLVVCIDDLDRCEPENVINLLSMIKHFFTYDERVKFICMLDKDAVSKAFLTRYGDVVKSKEYLEKIFDLNFTLNDSEDVSKLIKHYVTKEEDSELVESFFKNMGILNPRRMIKILNRTLFLERFLFKTDKHNDIFINTDDNPECINYPFKENSFFYSLLLYFVIYKEYYPDEFNRMFNFEEKLENLKNTRKLVKSDSGWDVFLKGDVFFNIIDKNIINAFIIKNRNSKVAYEQFLNFEKAENMETMKESKIDPLFYIAMPFFKENSFSNIDTNKEELIRASRGIDGDYPYNFMNIYYNESYDRAYEIAYNGSNSRKFFNVKKDTEINIYKLYKFVKDN